jgi:CHASE2 domain-containing sensor protein
MALPYPEKEPGNLGQEEKGKAVQRLIFSVFALDAIAVAGYGILVFVLGWDGTLPLIVLVAVSVVTGMYFQREKQKIEG